MIRAIHASIFVAFLTLAPSVSAQQGPPVITAVAPASAPPNSWVTLHGQGFHPQMTVSFNGAPVQTAGRGPTYVQALVPPNAVPGVFVVVAPNGQARSPVFTPLAAAASAQLAIRDFSPKSVAPGAYIRVAGNGFGDKPQVVTVLIGGVPAQIVGVAPNQITIRMPANCRGGRIDVDVAGRGRASTTEVVVPAGRMAVQGFMPAMGHAGQRVAIMGVGFPADARGLSVKLGGRSVTVVRSTSERVEIILPDDAVTGRFSVRSGKDTTESQADFRVVTKLAITSMTPARGQPGAYVTIMGHGFDAEDLRAFLGAVPVSLNVTSPGEAAFTVPMNAGTGKLTVLGRGAGSAASAMDFEVQGRVMIRDVQPGLGKPGGRILLRGTGFDPAPGRTAAFLGVVPLKVLKASPTEIMAELPQQISSGRLKVEVGGRGSFELNRIFPIQWPFALLGVDPMVGAPGTRVTVRGTGFAERRLSAALGQVPVALQVLSDTEAFFVVPSGARSASFVIGSTDAAQLSSPAPFEVLSAAAVVGFEPRRGAPGTRVVIRGSGFDPTPGRTFVYLGNVQLAIEPGATPNSLTVVVPEGVQSAPFGVKVLGRGSSRTPLSFNVLAPSAAPVAAARPAPAPATHKPAIAGLPALASAEDVYGAAPEGAPAPASAPAPAQKGTLSQDDLDLLLGATSPPDTGGVTVTSFEPAEAVAHDIITIYGTGFGEDPGAVRAWIGDVQAEVMGAVPDMMSISVPEGATSGHIRVRIGAGRAIESAGTLTVTP
ncbi:MAG: IPT/TIG domain-containing protein [Deltaproteobacteria bacterium]|nr:IPT/TIG domain-containing protein [Deltaproteobacteria bacterium]